MLKIFFPKLDASGSELRWIIADGLKTNPNIELVEEHDDADFCINYRHCNDFKNHHIRFDYRDQATLHNDLYYLCFKRSCVLKPPLTYTKDVRRGRAVPIAYAMKNDVENFLEYDKKKIDIACFFPQKIPNYNHRHREALAIFIEGLKTDRVFKKYRIHCGIVDSVGPKGRNSVNENYYKIIRKSKIVVTCNPSSRSGDYRLFEAFSGGSLVFIDQMIMPVKEPFVHEKHLVYFDKNNLLQLKYKLKYYLENELEAAKIAEEGYNHVLNNHRPRHRIQEMVDEIKSRRERDCIIPIDKFALNQSISIKETFKKIIMIRVPCTTTKNYFADKLRHVSEKVGRWGKEINALGSTHYNYILNHYITIALIRNPYERLVISYKKYIKRHDNISFENFILQKRFTLKPCYNYVHVKNGRSVKHIIKYENLQKDFPVFCKENDLYFPKLKISKECKKRNYTENMRNVVNDCFRMDFITYNYSYSSYIQN